MSEKRFTLNDKGIFDNQTKEQFNLIAWDWIECDIEEIVDKLNELYDENEQLKEENKLSEKRIQHWQTLYQELHEKTIR